LATAFEGHAQLVLDLETEAHLWLNPVARDLDPSVLSAWWDLLSDEEKKRHGSFFLDEAKLQYLTAWALARTSLSRYADIEPQAWRFQRGKHGRPEIVLPGDAPAGGVFVAPDPVAVPAAAEPTSVPTAAVPRLRFNLSHSGGLVACLVTLGVDAGVDVESTQRDLDMIRLADRFFSPEEAGEVRALTGAEQRERFFSYWTLKEAYLKACGRGLSIPLRQVSFRLAKGNSIGVRFAASLEECEGDWQFEVLRPLRNHLLAAAIRRGQVHGARRDLSIVVRQVVPLVEAASVQALPVVASTPR
jgi:4'-phosphopantetheinyl transferase